MENKDLKIKILAIQGILAIFQSKNIFPDNVDAFELVALMKKMMDVFEKEIRDDTEKQALESLLSELMEDVLEGDE